MITKDSARALLATLGAKIITKARGTNENNIGKIRYKTVFYEPALFADVIFSDSNIPAVAQFTEKMINASNANEVNENNVVITKENIKELFLEKLYEIIDEELDQEAKRIEDENKTLDEVEQIELFFSELGKTRSERKYVSKLFPVILKEKININDFFKPEDQNIYLDWITIADYYKRTCANHKKIFTLYQDGDAQIHDYLQNLHDNWRTGKMAELAYDESAIANADYFLNQLYDIYQPSFLTIDGINFSHRDMYKAAIRHFIWEIKRRGLFNITGITSGFLLCLSGGQGVGKSEFFRNICKPIIGDKFVENNMAILSDPFSINTLANSYCICFDEMIKSQNNDVQELKHLITSNTISKRKMHSENFHNKIRTASFCGTSNRPIYSVCYDSTGSGARRYLNIEHTCPSLVNDKEKRNKLTELFSTHLKDLWKSVNENLTDGYFSINDSSNKNNERLDFARDFYVPSTNLEKRWMEDRSLQVVVINSSRSNKNMTIEEGYKNFKEWCKEINQTPSSLETFQAFMKNSKRNAHLSKLRFKYATRINMNENLVKAASLFDTFDKELLEERLAQYKEEKNENILNDLDDNNDLANANPTIENILNNLN